MDVKKEKQPGIGTQGPMNKQPTAVRTQGPMKCCCQVVGTRGPMIKEQRQQQADKHEVLLKVVKSARVTLCDQAAKEKRVQMFQKMFHKQWDAEARGPEHDGAYLKQVTCLR